MAWTIKKYIEGGGSGTGNITIQDEGSTIKSDVNIINFVGVDVEAKDEGVANKVNVYIPTPDYAPFYNQDESTVPSISTTSRHVADPLGTFDIGDWTAGLSYDATNVTSISYNTPSEFSIKDNTSTTFTVTVYDADGISVLAQNSLTLTGNTSDTTAGITIEILDWALDSGRYKANAQVTIDISSIIGSSGRFSVDITHSNGSEGTFSKTQNDVFFDIEPNTASLSGVSISENVPVTKFISGVEYYTTGSTFNINVSDIDFLNGDSYPTTQVHIDAKEYAIGTVAISVPGSSLTGWTNAWNNQNASYSNSGHTINVPNATVISTTAKITAHTIDWVDGSPVASSSSNILIETHNIASNDTTEYFYNESYRCPSNGNFNLPNAKSWTSSNDVLSSDAVFVNGGCERNVTDWTIYNPNSGSQPNYTSQDATVWLYREFIHDGSASSGFTLYINGTYASFEYKLGALWDGTASGGTVWIDGSQAYNASQWNNGSPTSGGGQIGASNHFTFGTNNIINTGDTLYIRISFTAGQRIDQLAVVFD